MRHKSPRQPSQQGPYVPPTTEESRAALVQRIETSLDIQSLGQEMVQRIADAVHGFADENDPRPLILKRLERQIYLHYMQQDRLDGIASVILDRKDYGAEITVEHSDDTYDTWAWQRANPDNAMVRKWIIINTGKLEPHIAA